MSSDLGHQGEDGQFYTMEMIMAKLQHTEIDLLKMDIERSEYEVIASLPNDVSLLPQQISFEAHLHNAYGMWGRMVTEKEWVTMWEKLNSLGYEVFEYEPNPKLLCCCEYSIRKRQKRPSKPTKQNSKLLRPRKISYPNHIKNVFRGYKSNSGGKQSRKSNTNANIMSYIFFMFCLMMSIIVLLMCGCFNNSGRNSNNPVFGIFSKYCSNRSVKEM